MQFKKDGWDMVDHNINMLLRKLICLTNDNLVHLITIPSQQQSRSFRSSRHALNHVPRKFFHVDHNINIADWNIAKCNQIRRMKMHRRYDMLLS